ncbi:complement factor H-like [Pristis pectinata]|uniref:complement factor H-like n=1 Tax=Pristis pectinata TaxID=685728 RepID=UPI00223CCA3A|nr:complement factor H-like [Pristis pectinata]XP_051868096.1 complement factor H-like [Pristis pectinata]
MELTHFVILLGLFDSYFALSLSDSDCSPPQHLQNAEPILKSTNEVYSDGTIVTYQCNSGYVGILRYKCKNGEWISADKMLNCRLKPCGSPGDILHGTFELKRGDALVFGARIEYKCDEGYQLVGTRNYRDCEISGWSGLVPYCEVKTCPPVKAPENGRIIGPDVYDLDQDYPYGSLLTFECNSPDLQIQGAKEIYCLENATWSNPVPKCKELQCMKPDIRNGIVMTMGEVFRYLEQLHYTCNRNFKPSGISTTCTQFGWSPPPFCSPITCSRTSIENGQFLTSKWTFAYQETVNYTCNENYRPSGPSTVQCEAQGLMPNPSCVEIRCYRPNIDAHIYWYQSPKRVGEKIAYDCNHDGSRHFSVCTATGWNPPPKCPGPCHRPEIDNSLLPRKYSYSHGDTLSIKCKYGFRLQGTQNIRCQDGEWLVERSFPACIALGCDAPPAIANGRYSPNRRRYEENQRVTYSCIEGYELYGQKNLICGSSGWSEPPRCLDKQAVCRDPYPMVEHGEITSEKSYKITYACHAGYIQKGSDVVICADGKWSQPPTCSYPPDSTRVCGFPPAIESGDTVGISVPPYNHGQKVTYQCQNYYTLEGEKEVTCSGGEWSKPPRCIAPCILTEEDFTRNGIVLRWKFETRLDVKDGDVLEFRCREGFQIEPPARRYCRNGHLEVPRCISDDRSSCTALEYSKCQSCAGDEICTQYNAKRVSLTRPDQSTLLLLAKSGESSALFSVKRGTTKRKSTIKFSIRESNYTIMNVKFGDGPQSIQYEQPAIGEYCLTFHMINSITFNVTFTGNFSIRFDNRS